MASPESNARLKLSFPKHSIIVYICYFHIPRERNLVCHPFRFWIIVKDREIEIVSLWSNNVFVILLWLVLYNMILNKLSIYMYICIKHLSSLSYFTLYLLCIRFRPCLISYKLILIQQFSKLCIDDFVNNVYFPLKKNSI